MCQQNIAVDPADTTTCSKESALLGAAYFTGWTTPANGCLWVCIDESISGHHLKQSMTEMLQIQPTVQTEKALHFRVCLAVNMSL